MRHMRAGPSQPWPKLSAAPGEAPGALFRVLLDASAKDSSGMQQPPTGCHSIFIAGPAAPRYAHV